ncbi:uncharacterized protein LOC115631818 [Scaptodrosophila lebanonensis]|uniref:Uncharacterized protein LOC115631818 n=1 Tax=Drosophila lebanonensis TaxID=7225 RepID=A0A6J2U947_DROLE|nr:uncharacterized protein LOC115631818 [Scaptodrosophila lebanonensis]
MMAINVQFVETVVRNVPAAARGPSTAALQAYIDRANPILEKGTTRQKMEYVYELQDLFDRLRSILDRRETESQTIGMSRLGLLGVAQSFAEEEDEFYEKFVEGSHIMKSKISPEAVTLEDNFFEALQNYVDTTDFTRRDPVFQRFMSFRNNF